MKKAAGAPATLNSLKQLLRLKLFLALGDCGSCSSWVILDAIRLEKMGIPTISICSDRFLNFAHELAKSHGAEDLSILSVEHPIAGLSNDEIEEKNTAKLFLLLNIFYIYHEGCKNGQK